MSRLDASEFIAREPVSLPFGCPPLPRLASGCAPRLPVGQIEREVGSVALRLDFDDLVPLDGPAALTRVMVGDATLEVRHPVDLLQRLMDARSVSGRAAMFGADEAALVAEHLLAPHLEALEQLLGAPMRIVECGALEAPGPAVGGRLTLDGEEAGAIALDGDPAVLERLAKLGGRDRAQGDGIAFEAALEGRPVALPPGDFAALEPGDAVLLDVGSNGMGAERVVIGGGLGARVREVDGRHVLVEAPHPVQRSEAEGWPMMPKSDPETGDDPVTGSLPVTVAIELDRTVMPLAEIEGLQAGSVLPFGGGMPGIVRVLANGAPFADGEMVRVGERIGVRLIRFL